MSDEKVIFSMAGVNKIYPPQKQVLKKPPKYSFKFSHYVLFLEEKTVA